MIKVFKEEKEWTPQEIAQAEKRARNNPTYKKMEKICNKYGYVMPENLHIITYSDRESLSDNRIYPADKYTFKEEIYLDLGFHPSPFYNGPVKAQTGGRGALNLEEYTGFASDVQDTLGMLTELSELDLNTLEHIDYE